MISLHNYRILKAGTPQEEIVAVGNEAVFKTFHLTIPEPEKAESDAEAEEEQEEYIEPEPSPADVLLQETIVKTEALLENARIKADEISSQAYQEGFEQGKEDGLKAGRKEAWEAEQETVNQKIRQLEDQIAQYVTDMENLKDKILEEYLDDLKDISLAIGEKIVQTSLKSSGDVVKKMIIAATEKLKKTAWAKIYVAPVGNEMDIQGDAQLLKELSKLSDNVKIVVMDDAEAGTCVIELPHEIIDISTGTQMENIRDILNNARA